LIAWLVQYQAHGFLLQVRALANRYLAQDRVLTVADYDAGLPHFTFREAPRARAAVSARVRRRHHCAG